MNPGLFARSPQGGNKSFMKLRSFISTLTIVVAILLAIGIGGWFWLFSQNPLRLLNGAENSAPAAAMFVPKQAPLMTSLLVNPDRLESFWAVVARLGDRKQAKAEATQLKQALLANTGLDYKRDVQPWLGNELTLAVTTLDIDRDPATGRQPGYLLAISTRDAERAREFLQLYWQNRAIAGTDLVFEQYKGVKLIYGKSALLDASDLNQAPLDLASLLVTPTVATAAIGEQFILVANNPKVLRDAINNVQAPDLNLQTAQFYQQSLKALTQPRIGLSFVNLPGVSGWLTEQTVLPKRQSSDVAKSTPSASPQTLAIALELNRRGLLAETVALGGSQKSLKPTLSTPVNALQYIPASSPIVAAGSNLERFWNDLNADANNNSTQLLSRALSGLQQRWQLDLPKDVFAWVKDEYAIGLLPTEKLALKPTTKRSRQKSATSKLEAAKQLTDATTPFAEDWVFVAKRSGANAIQAIAHLDELASQQGLSVGAVQLGDTTVSAWTRLKAGVAQRSPLAVEATIQGVHTTLGDYEVFTTSLTAMAEAIKAVDASLAKGAKFQQAIAPLQRPNDGYFYLDWKAARPILEQQFPILKLAQTASESLTRHFESLALSSYGSEVGVQHGEIFMQLR